MPKCIEHKKWEHAKDAHAEIRASTWHNIRRLLEQHEHLFGGKNRDDHECGNGHRHQEAALHTTRCIIVVAGTDRMRDNGIDSQQQPEPEDTDIEKIEIAERDGSNGCATEITDHQHVCHAHRLLPNVDQHDWRGEARHIVEITQPNTRPLSATQHVWRAQRCPSPREGAVGRRTGCRL